MHGLLKSQGLYIYLSVLSGVTRGAGPAGIHSGRAPAPLYHTQQQSYSCSQIKISAVPLFYSDTLSSSAILFIGSLRSVQATFQSAILHTVSSLSVTQSTAAIITPHSVGTMGGSSTSAFSSAAQSKPRQSQKSLGGNRAPKFLTRFNFPILAPAINIICNYSLVSSGYNSEK